MALTHLLDTSVYCRGQRVPDLDLLIAATATTHGLTVATLNMKHFSRIPDLAVEDWSIAR